jgi:hypothetical protein
MLKSKIFYWVLPVALMLAACSDQDEDGAVPETQKVVTEIKKTVPGTQKAVSGTQKAKSGTQKAVSGTQKYYFLESVKLVELAGRTLQVGGMTTQRKINEALEMMDKGLELAFQVENQFLKSLDARLGKNYQRYFVKGIETYRLGIEAGIQSDQQTGLQLLGQWAEFWSAENNAIRAKLRSS